MAWSPKSERFHPPKLWKAMGTGMGTLMPTMPACTRWAKSRAVSPSRVKMRGAVAVLVLVDELEGGLEVVGADDAEDGSEDLFFVDPHLGLDVVEEAGAEEEAFACGSAVVAAVDDQFCAFGLAQCEVALDFVEVGAGDERAEVGALGLGARRDAERGDAGFEFGDQVVGGLVTDGDGDARWPCSARRRSRRPHRPGRRRPGRGRRRA